jgi:hypothetical protein
VLAVRVHWRESAEMIAVLLLLLATAGKLAAGPADFVV